MQSEKLYKLVINGCFNTGTKEVQEVVERGVLECSFSVRTVLFPTVLLGIHLR